MNRIVLFVLILLVILASAQNTELVAKKTAPNFYLKDLQGKSHFLNDYCGTKKSAYKKNEKNIVLLSFFATWCEPCRTEYKILEELAEEYQGKPVKFFLINVKEKKELVESYAEKNGIQLPILLDVYGVASKRYRITNLPRLFLITPEQTIAYDHTGFNAQEPLKEKLTALIDALLKQYWEK